MKTQHRQVLAEQVVKLDSDFLVSLAVFAETVALRAHKPGGPVLNPAAAHALLFQLVENIALKAMLVSVRIRRGAL